MEKGIGSLIGESGRTISNMDRMMADQAARQGMSPAEQRKMMIQKTAADMGRTISDRDAKLFGMGEISFEEAMSRARPSMDRVSGERNLMQQEQMFFPEKTSFRDSQQAFKGTPLGDALSYVPDLMQVADYMGLKNFAKGDEVSKFPDLTGDGKVTQADILKGRGVFQGGDEVTKEKKSFTDFQPEGALKGTFFDFVPDMFQVSAFLKDKFGSQAADSETIRQRFNKAFSEARAEGKDVFMFMGKPYNTMTLEEVEGMAEGGAVESEIDKGLEELQGVAPEAMVIQQVMTMVMEMIQSGASEEQIVAALKEMGLDEEDIQQVMMMVAEEMAGQESIDGQLAQMM